MTGARADPGDGIAGPGLTHVLANVVHPVAGEEVAWRRILPAEAADRLSRTQTLHGVIGSGLLVDITFMKGTSSGPTKFFFDRFGSLVNFQTTWMVEGRGSHQGRVLRFAE